MSLYRQSDDKTAAAPWRAVYDVLPPSGVFEALLDRLRHQDRRAEADAGPEQGGRAQ